MSNDVATNDRARNDVVIDDRAVMSCCFWFFFVSGVLVSTICIVVLSVYGICAMEEAHIKEHRKGLSEQQVERMRFKWHAVKMAVAVNLLLLAVGLICYGDRIRRWIMCEAAPEPMSPSDPNNFFGLLVAVFLGLCIMPLSVYAMECIREAHIEGHGTVREIGWGVATTVVALSSMLLPLELARCYERIVSSLRKVSPEIMYSEHDASKEVKTSNDVDVENIA